MSRWIVLAALALAGGCTQTAEQAERQQARTDRELADALDGRVAGTPQRCIDNSRVSGPQIVGNTLLYRELGRVVWRSDIEGCPALRPMTTIVVEIHGNQICERDRFRLLESGSSIPSSFCFFGKFTPYTRAE